VCNAILKPLSKSFRQIKELAIAGKPDHVSSAIEQRGAVLAIAKMLRKTQAKLRLNFPLDKIGNLPPHRPATDLHPQQQRPLLAPNQRLVSPRHQLKV
jgi:hypothetical protein